jgi:hypothetical protein
MAEHRLFTRLTKKTLIVLIAEGIAGKSFGI